MQENQYQIIAIINKCLTIGIAGVCVGEPKELPTNKESQHYQKGLEIKRKVGLISGVAFIVSNMIGKEYYN